MKSNLLFLISTCMCCLFLLTSCDKQGIHKPLASGEYEQKVLPRGDCILCLMQMNAAVVFRCNQLLRRQISIYAAVLAVVQVLVHSTRSGFVKNLQGLVVRIV